MRLVQKGQYKYKPNTNTQCFSMSTYVLFTNSNNSRCTYNRISGGMRGKLELEGEVVNFWGHMLCNTSILSYCVDDCYEKCV